MINYVDNQADFFRLLSDLEESRWIALDTEFVSERHFHPQLCLVQLAYESGAAILDPLAFKDINAFWELLTQGDHETIVHAGRADLEFCILATGTLPRKLFDTQLAAGFIGCDFPAGCANLISKVLKVDLPNTETRTDWTRRPLTRSQLEYGLDDVRYLHSLRTYIGGRIKKLGRWSWFEEEVNDWKEKLLWQFGPDRWEKLVQNSTFDQRSLAIVRELYFWRERRAQLADCPVKRILRDDLIIELARRQVYDIERIKDVRDFSQSNFAGILEPISDAIKYAMRLPKRDLPPLMEHDPSCKMTVLGQLLYSALGTICKQNNLACNLVGNPCDVRKWALWRMNPELHISLPIMEQGWRKLVVGSVFEELISGNMVIRVADPTSEEPLEFLRKVQ